VTVLTNIRSDRVKTVRALSRRSMRERTGLFLAEGPQAVREAVTHRPETVRDLYVTQAAAARHTDILAAARDSALSVHRCSDDVLASMCDTDAPQGLLAVCRVVTTSFAQVLATRPRLLVVLSQVRDPGNAGTVLRGADAFGADAVIVTASSVDIHAPKVVRSTAGSIFHVPVVTGMAIEDVLRHLREAGVRTLAADGAGTTTLTEVDLNAPHAWVMGNEAWGLPEPVRQECDEVVRVPIHGLAESLNLAMAATVCLYESSRLR